ncbi:MAG: endonuclease MutS2 [Bacteroidota bacterium]
MLYPKDIFSKLGFNQILDLLRSRCRSSLGLERVDKIRFSNNFDHVAKLLSQTAEFKHILSSGDAFPGNYYIDVRPHLEHAKVEGTFLQEVQFKEISKSLITIRSISKFLSSRQDEYPSLNALLRPDGESFVLIEKIDSKIDEDNRLKDSASIELARIRKNIGQKHRQVRKVLRQEFDTALKSGFIPEGASMTVRDGRMVIPLAAEYKKRVKGFVHDESSTGQTVFLEPTSVLEGNNELRELEYAEKRESIRILTSLTDDLRAVLNPIQQAYGFLGFVDFIQAKARLAVDLAAELPLLKPKPYLNWVQARHPLLYLAHQESKKEIVPLTISLDASQRILVISGPNAGGKSVCLKTVGLLQLMLQSGLMVPVAESSEFGFFDDIFIDIGDEQSIENDLSTYSSHLSNMKHFMKQGRANTLVLIDEFGTGTDPQFGGAIAQAVLEELNEKAVFGVVTTHYGNIKGYGEETAGLANGAMKYDMANLKPLYQLEVGKPGSSFSLEIARKIGISHHIINNAKELIGDQTVDLDKLLMRLERQKQKTLAREKSIKEREKEVEQLESKYSKLLNELESNKKQIITKAKSEAETILKDTNREIEKTIRHIKENKAEKSETVKARQRLDSLKRKVSLRNKPEPKILEEPIEVGDAVRVLGQEAVGEVLSIRGKGVEIQFGDLKSTVKMNRLEKVSKKASKTIKKQISKGIDLNQRLAGFSSTLDVRGKRAEEVFSIVDTFLDNAVLFGRGEVKILHGKGDGILRKLIREHLKGTPYISSIQDEHIERGGAGISVVQLK